MSMIRTERKYIEILRILREHQEPMGAKRLSELMAERGFVLSDRAVQYYLSYLDTMGFTEKIGNQGRVLTPEGRQETDSALVDDRIGFIISKLERLAYRSTFDPSTGTGDVAYNLSIVPESSFEQTKASFDDVIKAGCGFFSSYRIIDKDPRVPSGSVGFISLCSISMDGVFQRNGIPVNMAFGGRLELEQGMPKRFRDLIGYRGTTIDPLELFISSNLTTISDFTRSKTGIALANVREVPSAAREKAEEIIRLMNSCGFVFPIAMGNQVFNLPDNPFRLSIVAFSGMNFTGNCVEHGIEIKTEIGAGNIPFSKIIESN
ncbi:MAG: Ribonuclease R winged-helix domain protein [Methanoregula sp. PtaU1.Bin006]|nr:MAG: Ribonuclease R winged-helix domain protein [Methanoregula sp. PtaB.Bin085]OPY36521.1 MAG: Ribonuclease R winged-helix domain protein [Methanoregula sp. PtaU1.Bin006]